MSEKLKSTSYGEDYESENERKTRALEDAVEANRPQFIDFKKFYTPDYIERAKKELSEKLKTEQGTGDDDGKLAEWEFAYVLGYGEILPGCRASLASEYDDHMNGVDIVCKLEGKDSNKPYVFCIDICTATLPDAVSRKFARGDHPRGDVPAGCSYIKFYKDKDFATCLKGVPRFVVGASPLFISDQKYLDNFHIENDGTVSHSHDRDLQFNILSSLFIQSLGLERKLSERGTGDELICKRAIETCKAVRLASGRALHKLIGVKQGENFIERLNEELKKARELKVNGYRDDCYANVIKESLKRQKPNYVAEQRRPA